MAVTAEKLVGNLKNLTTCTVSFPLLMHDAVKLSIITRAEKEEILTKYKSIYDKLATFYMLVSTKGPEALEKLEELLETTGNDEATNFLKAVPTLEDDILIDIHEQSAILDNLDRLCSHTMNLSLVLGFATGLELIRAKEREIIAEECVSEVDQLAAFYSLVATKGPGAFEKLIQVLRMTNNFWALEVLHYHD